MYTFSVFREMVLLRWLDEEHNLSVSTQSSEREGFEPPVPVKILTLSRLPP